MVGAAISDPTSPGVTIDALRSATIAKFPRAFDKAPTQSKASHRSHEPTDHFDWHRPLKSPRIGLDPSYFVEALSQSGDRSAVAATVINRCLLSGWSPEEIVATLLDHGSSTVMGHYGGDDGKLRADVRRLALKPNPNDPDEKFKAALDAWLASHPSATQEETATYADYLRQTRRKWNFTKPSDDADQPPLAYWDENRGALGKGMLPRVIGGCAVIVWGKKSSHKSGLLIKECLDAALMKGAKVLYLACEGAHGIRTARLPAACRQRRIGIEAIDDLWRTFPASPGLMNNAEIDELIARCREEGFEPDIIVVDTLTRAVAGFDINAPATGAGLILGMERFAAAFDATVVAVTHPGKDSDKGAIGSSLIESLAFSIWRVGLDGEAVFAEVQKMKDGPAEFTVPFKVTWLGKGGEQVQAGKGTPVVVEVAPGEQLARASQSDDAQVSEGVVRGVLVRCQAYGAAAGLPEEVLLDQIAGPLPEDGETLEWETRRKKIASGLRAARNQKVWAKRLCDQRVRITDGPLVWVWFLPETEHPMTVAEPSGRPW